MACSPEVVLSSPAARALATSKVIAQALKLPVTIENALGPDSPMKDLRTLVHGLIKGMAPVLIVSHKDQLENLIFEMIGKDLDLGYCGFLCLSAQFQAGQLRVLEISSPNEED